MVDDEEVWNDTFQSLQSTDTLVLGRVMYPAYGQYWLNLLANPSSGSNHEVEYARRADKIPHIVLPSTATTSKSNLGFVA